MTIRENFGFYEGQKVVIDFESILINNKIKIGTDSDIESKFLSVLDIIFHFEEHKKQDNSNDFRPLFRDFSAVYDLALKILNVQNHADFNQLIPHLKKLNSCSIAQNQESIITDQDANKIIELYIASLCMRFCKKIRLDHPHNSTGINPDIIAEINGKNWGFACKTIHTKNPQTIYENIQKAIDQIEKSDSLTGIPVINLKNKINHENLWPLHKTFPSKDEPFKILISDVNSFPESLLNDIGIDFLKNLFIGKKSLPGILFIAQSVSSVNQIATRINVMNLFRIDEEKFQTEDLEVFEKLNHFMQLAN